MASLNVIFKMYLCLAVPGPLCFAGCSLVVASGGSSVAVVHGLPTAVASLAAEHGV